MSAAVASRSISSSSEPASRISAFSNAALERLAQRTAKQRVIIDDDESVVDHAPSKPSPRRPRDSLCRRAADQLNRPAEAQKTSGFLHPIG